MDIKKTPSLTLALFFILILTGCGQPRVINVSVTPDETKIASGTPTAVKPLPVVSSSLAIPIATKTSTKIPASFQLVVAFAPQAPFANWDTAHEEACEEASMIMVNHYFSHEPLNEQIMEQELEQLLKWEKERGYQVDLTTEQVIQILRDYFGRTARLLTSVNVDQIKYEISQNKPIIMPAAGRELDNPNFKTPGPIYHMLVVKGYNNREFITNDPGTRKGNGWAYSYSKLINAIHDWDPAEAASSPTGMTETGILKGRKVMIVVDN